MNKIMKKYYPVFGSKEKDATNEFKQNNITNIPKEARPPRRRVLEQRDTRPEHNSPIKNRRKITSKNDESGTHTPIRLNIKIDQPYDQKI